MVLRKGSLKDMTNNNMKQREAEKELKFKNVEISNLKGAKTENIRLLLADKVEVCGKPGENLNSMVVGPPGCGKTFSTMLPTILCENECSMVIDDKKGNLYNKSAEELKKRGYKVYKIDFINFNGDFKYNCFQNIKTQEDMMRLADFMVPPQGEKVDRYWEMSAKSLLRCLLEIAKHEWGSLLNLKRFMKLFNSCSYKDEGGVEEDLLEKDGIAKLIKKHMDSGYRYEAMEEYIRIRSVPDRTWNCTLNSLRIELVKYSSSQLHKITEETTVNFSSLGKRKVAIFVVSSDTDKSMYPMVQLMYQDMADCLIQYANQRCAKNENRLPVHVRFLVDDFASGVQQINFENIIANCRSRNISYMLGFQSISQLEALYGKYSNTILDCINYQIFYSSTNLDTNNYLARAMQRPVREIQQMNENTVCLIQRGKMARFCKRIQTLELPEYQRCIENEKNKSETYRATA